MLVCAFATAGGGTGPGSPAPALWASTSIVVSGVVFCTLAIRWKRAGEALMGVMFWFAMLEACGVAARAARLMGVLGLATVGIVLARQARAGAAAAEAGSGTPHI